MEREVNHAHDRGVTVGSGTDPILLATHHVVLVLVGATSSKSLRLRHFKSDRDEM